MAGVKTQKGGIRKEPVWHGGSCAACNNPIESHAKAVRFKSLAYTGARATVRWDWRHKACNNLGGK